MDFVPPVWAHKWTPEEINRLPLRQYDGPVRVIRTPREAARAARLLRKEKVLGFDTETRPSFRKGEVHPPAVLQLAAADCVYVICLNQTGLLPPLRSVLSAPEIVKAGVAPERDVAELSARWPFRPAGFVDLAREARRRGIPHHGLRGLAAAVLGFRVPKGAQKSNWARARLTPAQIRYAATDAWVSREIFLKLRAGEGHAPACAEGVGG